MAIRSQEDIARDMKAWLEARVRVVDTGVSTVLYALLLQGLAKVLADAFDAQDTAETAQGIGSPSAVSQFDLDDIAYNLNMVRKASSASSGFITFRRPTVPDVTIRVGAEDGTGGVVVGTARDANGAATTFKTTSTVFFTTSATQDPVSGFYEVSAPITATQAGSVGNKAAGSVVSIITPVTGVTSVTNKTATANGKDTEGNEDFAVRLVSKILGFQPGILEGLRTIALEQAGVQDAAVVGPDDSEFQRSLIGAVDLVIKGSSPSTAQDLFQFDGTAHQLSSRPAGDIVSVVSIVGLSQSSLVEGGQWSFSQDLVSEERLSTVSNDHLSWLGTSLPNSGADVTVTYTYDALVKSIQDVLDQDDKHYPAASVMVKSGIQVFLDFHFTIRRTGAVSTSILTNRIATAISNYVASLGLGALVTESALVGVIKTVSGIRQLSLPFSTFCRRGASGADDVQLTLYEYPGVDAQSISITYTN